MNSVRNLPGWTKIQKKEKVLKLIVKIVTQAPVLCFHLQMFNGGSLED